MSSRALTTRATTAGRLRGELAPAYPDLSVEVRAGVIRIYGPLRLLDGNREVDRYEIDALVPDDFPRGVPAVYEVGGRITRDADHHMYPDGRACLFAPGERWRHWPAGKGIVEFIDGPVRSFFIGQSLFELTGEWPFGQRSHGAAGILEAFGEMLRVRRPEAIVRYLEVLSRRKLRPRSPCPCGSGLPIHSCHLRNIADLRGKVPYREARHALSIILVELQRRRQRQAN